VLIQWRVLGGGGHPIIVRIQQYGANVIESEPEQNELVNRRESSSASITPDVPSSTRGKGWFSRGVLRHKHFRTVWFGAFCSSVGAWVEFVGVSWIINTTTEQPALYLGWHAAAQLVPMMLLGIAGGVVADRVNRKKLLIVTQIGMMLIALALTLLSWLDLTNIWALMILTALLGSTMAFNVPAWQVLTPRLVPREELTDAIMLNGLQFNIARVVGPALGGLLLAWQGPTVLFALNTLSFLGVIVAVWTTPDSPAPARNPHDSIWKETVDGIRFALYSVGPRAVFMAMSIFAFLAAPLQRMLPLFVSTVYFTKDMNEHSQEIAYGILLGVMGVGAVLGVVILKQVPKWYPKHHLIPMSILVSGLALVGFSFTDNPWIALPCLIVAGMGWMASFNLTSAAMQLLVPDALRGRVMAVSNTAVFGAMALGPILTGFLSEAVSSTQGASFGTQVGVGLAAIIMIGAGLVMLVWRTPEVDGLKPGEQGFVRRPGLWEGITARSHRPSRMEESIP
jgi:MFS family permease